MNLKLFVSKEDKDRYKNTDAAFMALKSEI